MTNLGEFVIVKALRGTIAVGACLLAALAAANARAEVVACTAGDIELRVDRETGRVESLRHLPNKATWADTPFSLFRVAEPDQLRTGLDVLATEEGVLLTLQIVNTTTVPRAVAPVFSDLQLRGDDAADHRQLRYCFPARSGLVGRENRTDAGWYSGIFPVQFMAVDHPRRGSLHVVVCDTANDNRKTFELGKTDGELRLCTRYEPRRWRRARRGLFRLYCWRPRTARGIRDSWRTGTG